MHTINNISTSHKQAKKIERYTTGVLLRVVEKDGRRETSFFLLSLSFNSVDSFFLNYFFLPVEIDPIKISSAALPPAEKKKKTPHTHTYTSIYL